MRNSALEHVVGLPSGEEYLDNTDPNETRWKCKTCMCGARCNEVHYLSDLEPDDGYWAVPKEFDLQCEMFFKCPFPEDCIWEQYKNGSSCGSHHNLNSIGCSVCEVGNDRVGNKCVPCREMEIKIRFAMVVLVVLVLVCLFTLVRKRFTRFRQKHPRAWRAVKSSLGGDISFTQINLSLGTVINDKMFAWPSIYVEFLKVWSPLDLNLLPAMGIQ